MNDSPRSYGFASRPLWILSHVLVIVGVLVMVRLGFWQMSRWQEESDAAERIEVGLADEPVPLGELLGDRAPDESVEFTRAAAVGMWDLESEVVVRNRSNQGRPGGWLLTPLVQPDGTAVAVVRGWIPMELVNEGPPYPGTEVPAVETAVVGVVGLDQPGGGLGPQDPTEGELDSLARVDLERLSRQLDEPLEPVWLTLQASQPPQPDPGSSDATEMQPVVVAPPEPSQNFSYMVQWFLFASIAAGGYVLVLRKIALGSAGRSPDAVAPGSTDPEKVDV